jgi:protein CpxP
MKKLLIIALLGLGVFGFAQKEKEQYSPEQKAEIMSKKMRNSLDLSEQQTKEVKAVLLSKIEKNKELRDKFKAKKESGVKLTKDERFEMQSAMLDEKAATKEDFKKILTPEQYARFEEKMNGRKENMLEKKEDRKDKRAEKKANKNEKTEK